MRLKTALALLLVIFGLNPLCSRAQENLRCMFYNVENLFDTEDDPHKNDNEFLPESDKKWTPYRYHKKLNSIYQVIIAAGNPLPPDIVGFAELENHKVIAELVQNTPLSHNEYRVVHFESPDMRGIDVGLIYRANKLKLLYSRPIVVKDSSNSNWKTRDILYAKFHVAHTDTLHVFINHWPSRMGGQKKSDPKRLLAAGTLRQQTDSLLQHTPCANILIMGDFNDEPHNKSLTQGLQATPFQTEVFRCDELYNLSGWLQQQCNCGSFRYRAEWNMLDQVIVSGRLLINGPLHIDTPVVILRNDFLLEDDEKYGGQKVKRTYSGPRYLGGYSDHLPVFIDINIRQ